MREHLRGLTHRSHGHALSSSFVEGEALCRDQADGSLQAGKAVETSVVEPRGQARPGGPARPSLCPWDVCPLPSQSPSQQGTDRGVCY